MPCNSRPTQHFFHRRHPSFQGRTLELATKHTGFRLHQRSPSVDNLQADMAGIVLPHPSGQGQTEDFHFAHFCLESIPKCKAKRCTGKLEISAPWAAYAPTA